MKSGGPAFGATAFCRLAFRRGRRFDGDDDVVLGVVAGDVADPQILPVSRDHAAMGARVVVSDGGTEIRVVESDAVDHEGFIGVSRVGHGRKEFHIALHRLVLPASVGALNAVVLPVLGDQGGRNRHREDGDAENQQNVDGARAAPCLPAACPPDDALAQKTPEDDEDDERHGGDDDQHGVEFKMQFVEHILHALPSVVSRRKPRGQALPCLFAKAPPRRGGALRSVRRTSASKCRGRCCRASPSG